MMHMLRFLERNMLDVYEVLAQDFLHPKCLELAFVLALMGCHTSTNSGEMQELKSMMMTMMNQLGQVTHRINAIETPNRHGQGKFHYDDCYDYWVVKTIVKRWKDYKCHLKSNCYYKHDTVEEMIRSTPEDVDEGQWATLVCFWNSKKGKKRSTVNTNNRKKQKIAHTSGTKSFAMKAKEMRENWSPTKSS
ncbi:uncharacterized protein LOC119999045 [Tripterygium wilfordii]|uniref:uncharacterized protein LOC119999045 n=1 Tax=Tripterygium wilfordii TaxID=458696 RepID=UPI0018F864DD|nr:uncharacterized protein LOC119999045 [Tripterygium wilfordii]